MKKSLFLIILFVIALCFSACGNTDDACKAPALGIGSSAEEDGTSDTVGTSTSDNGSSTEDDDKSDTVYDCEIIYDLNGGSFEGDTKNMFLSDKGVYSDIKPIREGYKFYGWINKKSGECVDKIEIAPGKSANYEFYAIWYTDVDDDGYVLSKNEDAYSVVWYSGAINKDLRVPSEYNGAKVNKIDKYAFYHRSDLDERYLFLPNTINEIGSYAFERATGLYIQLSDEKELDKWIENLKYDDTNIQAIEVIKGERPAIGWSKWVI